MSEPIGWGIHPLSEGASCSIEIGPLAIRMRLTEGEVRARVHRPGDETVPETRWALGPIDSVEVSPLMPDRPLIVEPDEPFWLVAGAEARIYVRVPLRVHVEAVGGRRYTLLEEPTLVTSDTWWGTLEEGELCYWLPTRARRRWSDDLVEPHLVACPLRLVNRSEDDLHVDKVALRVAYLSIFRVGGALWSDETRVLYTGEAEGSRLEMAGRAPDEAPEATRVAHPVERMGRGFRARTFRRLREITGLSG